MFVDTEELAYRMKLEPITAAELAYKVGISRQSMYNILNGKSQPRPSTLNRICAALGCTPNVLLERRAEYPESEYERMASLMVERYSRERSDYDVEAVALDYVGNWLMERYGELTSEQYAEAKAEADHEGQEFAAQLARMFTCFEMLGVSNDTRTQATIEAFTLLFDNLPGLIDTVFESEPDDVAQAIYEEELAEKYEEEQAEKQEEYEEEQRIRYEEELAEKYEEEQ